MERIIELTLEACGDAVLVSSKQFPLFHLAIQSTADEELERCVLPMLVDLIYRERGERVVLYLISEYGDEDVLPTLAAHVIARAAPAIAHG